MFVNVNVLFCHHGYAYYDKTAEARITRFYLSYLHIRFDDKIKGILFEFWA